MYARHSKIVSPWEVDVNGQRLSARHIVVATGARPLVPPIPGLADLPYLTSDTVWDRATAPKHLLVLGGGPIGCELAQSFARLGIKVSQVELAPQLLPREDKEVAEIIQESLKKDGVNILTGWKAVKFSQDNGQMQVTLNNNENTQDIEFDQVLLALGRVANVKGFGLEELGVKFNTKRHNRSKRLLTNIYPYHLWGWRCRWPLSIYPLQCAPSLVCCRQYPLWQFQTFCC